ncbi:MAG: hypothetical protein H6978_15695 [Gammaproteobacteria bacterium]|nr:hypothetical protein [Gammaproteobacteria bacterium]
MKPRFLWAITIVACSCASFFVGTRVGVYEFIKSDAQYKASIIAHEITALRGTRRDEMIQAKEVMLDGELANHGKYMESWLKWLWYSPYRDDRPIEYAANYRKEHPYELPNTSDPGESRNTSEYTREELEAFAQELRLGEIENRRLVRLVLKTYAQ